eukprot:g759.t1
MERGRCTVPIIVKVVAAIVLLLDAGVVSTMAAQCDAGSALPCTAVANKCRAVEVAGPGSCHPGYEGTDLRENFREAIVGTLTASDENAGSVHSFSTTSTMFEVVDGNKLRLREGASLDFESAAKHEFDVTATDDGPIVRLSKTQRVTLNVLDVNERPTSTVLVDKASQSQTLTIREHARVTIGEFVTVDPDRGQVFTYTLKANEKQVPVEVNGATLSVIGDVDYETTRSFQVIVETTDSGSPPLSRQDTFQVAVVNVNEAPTAVSLSGTGSVPENSAPGAVVGKLLVQDPDDGDKHTCTLRNHQDSFTLDSLTLSVAGALDYEDEASSPIRSLNFDCVDEGGLRLENAKVDVRIQNMNEPISDILLSVSSIVEHAKVGSFVGELSVKDEDQIGCLEACGASGCAEQLTAGAPSRTCSTYTYRVLGDDAHFKTEGSSLLVASDLDYESNTVHTIQIEVTGPGCVVQRTNPPSLTCGKPEIALKNFTISVVDANDAPRAIFLSRSIIPENLTVGSVVATMSTDDPDLPSIKVGHVYSIEEGKDYFHVENGSNVITLLKSVDFEARPSFDLGIRSVDAGGKSVHGSFVIHLMDCNDAPTFTSLQGSRNQTFHVGENTFVGSTIAHLDTSDPDAGQTFTYFIGAESPVSPGEDPQEVILSAALNFEEQSVYSILIRTRDNGSPALERIDEFKLLVIDENDRPSAILHSATAELAIGEMAENGTVVTQLTTVDEDLDQTHVYALSMASPPGPFGCTPDGRIIVKNSNLLDFEEAQSHEIEIVSRDSGSPVLSVSALFKISVVDEDDAPTDISVDLVHESVSEGSSLGSYVGTAVITDPDTKEEFLQNELSIGEGSFSIFSKEKRESGVYGITLKKALDFEVSSKEEVELTVLQSGQSSQSELRKKFIFQVGDVNEPASDIELQSSASIPENLPSGSVVGTIVAKGDPETNHQEHTFRTVSNEFFGVNEEGELISKRELNFEQTPTISVQVEAVDNGVPPEGIIRELTVNVRDANDAPRIVIESRSPGLPKNSPKGAAVLHLRVRDEDAGQKHSCQVTPEELSISEPTDEGALTVALGSSMETLLDDSMEALSITVTCTDNGTPAAKSDTLKL